MKLLLQQLEAHLRGAANILRREHRFKILDGSGWGDVKAAGVLPVAQLAAGDAATLMPQVRRRRGATTGQQDHIRRRTS
jgi:hypothetical protein